mmetsp:Transcript_4040/g.5962  ORF Transcript_4040/g.5962 Transcript_4040/m.5962 type:complete len:438 (+) Transcript_4040:61-1374(+)
MVKKRKGKRSRTIASKQSWKKKGLDKRRTMYAEAMTELRETKAMVNMNDGKLYAIDKPNERKGKKEKKTLAEQRTQRKNANMKTYFSNIERGERTNKYAHAVKTPSQIDALTSSKVQKPSLKRKRKRADVNGNVDIDEDDVGHLYNNQSSSKLISKVLGEDNMRDHAKASYGILRPKKETEVYQGQAKPTKTSYASIWDDSLPQRQKKKKKRTSSQPLQIMTPHPGQSYNPDLRQYEDALVSAAKAEVKAVIRRDRIDSKLRSADPSSIPGGNDILDGIRIRQREYPEEDIPEHEKAQPQEYGQFPKKLTLKQKLGRRQQFHEQRLKRKKELKKLVKADDVDAILEDIALGDVKHQESKKRRRQFKKQQEAKKAALDPIASARDILLGNEMRTRMSATSQKSNLLVRDRVRALHHQHVRHNDDAVTKEHRLFNKVEY